MCTLFGYGLSHLDASEAGNHRPRDDVFSRALREFVLGIVGSRQLPARSYLPFLKYGNLNQFGVVDHSSTRIDG
jgi:hypothetical protein